MYDKMYDILTVSFTWHFANGRYEEQVETIYFDVSPFWN